jgi:hypothetical protein
VTSCVGIASRRNGQTPASEWLTTITQASDLAELPGHRHHAWHNAYSAAKGRTSPLPLEARAVHFDLL